MAKLTIITVIFIIGSKLNSHERSYKLSHYFVLVNLLVCHKHAASWKAANNKTPAVKKCFKLVVCKFLLIMFWFVVRNKIYLHPYKSCLIIYPLNFFLMWS